ALPNVLINWRDGLRPAYSGVLWDDMPRNVDNQWAWSVVTLYRTPPTDDHPAPDADAAVNRARLMMVIAAVGLGVIIARWSWKIAGPAAAIAAVTFFALDPTLLAHSPLVVNDVPMALAFCVLTYGAWQLGRRITPWTIVLTAVGGAMAVT